MGLPGNNLSKTQPIPGNWQSCYTVLSLNLLIKFMERYSCLMWYVPHCTMIYIDLHWWYTFVYIENTFVWSRNSHAFKLNMYDCKVQWYSFRPH